jgi:hypothetical protein
LANPLDKALEFYTRLYLQEDILVKVDRAAMMNSLETRAVFLDNDLVDFVAGCLSFQATQWRQQIHHETPCETSCPDRSSTGPRRVSAFLSPRG